MKMKLSLKRHLEVCRFWRRFGLVAQVPSSLINRYKPRPSPKNWTREMLVFAALWKSFSGQQEGMRKNLTSEQMFYTVRQA